MSILVQNVSAAFVQSAQPDGRYHLVLKADLVGHSELQDRLIKKIAQSLSKRTSIEIVKGANDVPQLQVHLSANEKEIAELLVKEDENRNKQKVLLDRSYTDIAADAKLAEGKKSSPQPQSTANRAPAPNPGEKVGGLRAALKDVFGSSIPSQPSQNPAGNAGAGTPGESKASDESAQNSEAPSSDSEAKV